MGLDFSGLSRFCFRITNRCGSITSLSRYSIPVIFLRSQHHTDRIRIPNKKFRRTGRRWGAKLVLYTSGETCRGGGFGANGGTRCCRWCRRMGRARSSRRQGCGRAGRYRATAGRGSRSPSCPCPAGTGAPPRHRGPAGAAASPTSPCGERCTTNEWPQPTKSNGRAGRTEAALPKRRVDGWRARGRRSCGRGAAEVGRRCRRGAAGRGVAGAAALLCCGGERSAAAGGAVEMKRMSRENAKGRTEERRKN